MDLKGEIAVVTGGAKEIGRSISLRLAEGGATVVIADVDEKAGQETADFIQDRYNQEALFCRVDITDETQVAELVETVENRFGTISILVNNAGIMGPVDHTENIDGDAWDFTMLVNLKGMFLCTKHMIPGMKRRKDGKIINISSVSAKRALPLRLPYSTSKMGVIGFTRTLAAEVGKDNIRVNCVCPGSVMGERQKHVFEGIMKATGKTWEEVKKEKADVAALKSFVDPKYIANCVFYLSSPESWAVTGQDINVCAGAVMW